MTAEFYERYEFSLEFLGVAAGKLPMTFGPKNRDGGERRLNVAVTRSRQELKVFSGIRAEDIDLGRSKQLGVRHLKNFLRCPGRDRITSRRCWVFGVDRVAI